MIIKLRKKCVKEAMNIYTISMRNSSPRKVFHDEQARKFHIDIKYFDAVNGAELSEQEFEALRYTYLRPLSKGEVGCFLSHKALWEKCAALNEAIIILEDDAILSPNFMDAASQVMKLKNIDRVNLEGYYPQKKTFGKHVIPLRNFNLTELYQERAGAAAYVLWPSGAVKLLEHYKNKATLADVALKERFLVTYQLEPVVAVQAMICDHYNIPHSLTLNHTTLDSAGKHSDYSKAKGILLKCRRIANEIKKSLVNLRYIFAKKRTVFVDNQQFTPK
jgi:glycosyl transferase family 25